MPVTKESLRELKDASLRCLWVVGAGREDARAGILLGAFQEDGEFAAQQVLDYLSLATECCRAWKEQFTPDTAAFLQQVNAENDEPIAVFDERHAIAHQAMEQLLAPLLILPMQMGFGDAYQLSDAARRDVQLVRQIHDAITAAYSSGVDHEELQNAIVAEWSKATQALEVEDDAKGPSNPM